METLTEREREIFELWEAGKSKREIGDLLFISHHTVKAYLLRVARILAKTGLRSM
jgi:DNA-binding CsgD family transcriptional regulator